jgi:carboxylesterase type B
MFGFGNLDGQSFNLGLRDQQMAITWVRTHIPCFGGDSDSITLAGESAGAFCIHAHTLMFPKGVIRRAILQSGHLWTSPPQPLARGKALVESIRAKVHEMSPMHTLETLPADQLLLVLKVMNLKSVWNHEQPGLEDWEHRVPTVEAVLMGDCGHEASIFAHKMAHCSPGDILTAFEPLDLFQEVLSSYHIEVDRPLAAITGALDIIADVRFSWSAHRAATAWKTRIAVIQYIFDEPNPWQPSAGAHHAVDLLFLFGAYQKYFPAAAAKLSVNMRKRWIDFIGAESFGNMPNTVFGPHGITEAMQQDCFSMRRRTSAWQVLDKVGFSTLNLLTGKLGAGKISLDS